MGRARERHLPSSYTTTGDATLALADARYDRLKVIDIAHDCGFNDVSHFNRCFRRRFGVTPSDIRFGSVAGPH